MLHTDNPLRPLVRKLAAHATLSDADREAVLSLPFKSRTMEPHTYIIREGDSPKAACLLVSGFAYRQKHTGDGSRQIVALLIRGDLIDLQNLYLDESDHGVQALTRAEVAFIGRADLQALAQERPAVGRALFVEALIEASMLREWVLNLGRRNAPARLAHVLCELAVRLEAQGLTDRFGYHFPMTQEQLADVTGLTPVHVNRTLKALEAQGLITRERRRFLIPDWHALRDAGDFNERYLHEQVQESASRLSPELI